jgi:hypothetical protein
MITGTAATGTESSAAQAMPPLVAPWDSLVQQLDEKGTTLQKHFIYWFEKDLPTAYKNIPGKKVPKQVQRMKRQKQIIRFLLRFVDSYPPKRPCMPREIISWKNNLHTVADQAVAKVVEKLQELGELDITQDTITPTDFVKAMETNQELSEMQFPSDTPPDAPVLQGIERTKKHKK